MGTRSLIGYERSDGTVIHTYCHWDGYPAGVGAQLVKNYAEEYQARQIAELGYASDLQDTLHETRMAAQAAEAPSISLDAVDYARDSGGIAWLYLFRQGEWYHRPGDSISHQWVLTKENM